jgi:hypothetical protein
MYDLVELHRAFAVFQVTDKTGTGLSQPGKIGLGEGLGFSMGGNDSACVLCRVDITAR